MKIFCKIKVWVACCEALNRCPSPWWRVQGMELLGLSHIQGPKSAFQGSISFSQNFLRLFFDFFFVNATWFFFFFYLAAFGGKVLFSSCFLLLLLLLATLLRLITSTFLDWFLPILVTIALTLGELCHMTSKGSNVM